MEGFRRFVSSWLWVTADCTLVVDPGPLTTIPRLVSELRRRQVSRVDYILLTHIHIDHAGGTGALLREFPEATVVCHPDGIRHLSAPEKLWEGSRKVLGSLADLYGEIVPVPAERLVSAAELDAPGIRAFLTPGHAQHHCCYLVDDLLFGGEVAGVRCELPGAIYMRPATPPRFVLEVALESIERMIALAPRRLVFAHYGLVDTAVEHLRIARKQLLLWVQGVASFAAVDEGGREEALLAWLLERDENFAAGSGLPADIAVRERYFLGNTLKGMTEYVQSLTEEERQAIFSAPFPLRSA